MIHRTDVRLRFAFADVCVGVALGLFFGGIVIAFDDPGLGAYLLLGAVAIIAAGRVIGGCK